MRAGEPVLPGEIDQHDQTRDCKIEIDAMATPVVTELMANPGDDAIAGSSAVLQVLPGAFGGVDRSVDRGLWPETGLVVHLVFAEVENDLGAADRIGPEEGIDQHEEAAHQTRLHQQLPTELAFGTEILA